MNTNVIERQCAYVEANIISCFLDRMTYCNELWENVYDNEYYFRMAMPFGDWLLNIKIIPVCKLKDLNKRTGGDNELPNLQTLHRDS